MKEKIVLIGGGGHCKSVIDTIMNNDNYDIVGITDVEEKVGDSICGVNIIGTDKILLELFDKSVKNAFITLGSIGNSSLREKLYLEAIDIGYNFPCIIESNSIRAKDCSIGAGTFVGKGVILNTEVIIGENCIINTGAIIEHECVVDDFVHIAPGCVLSGHVTVGKYSHIGTNTTIIQDLVIGRKVLIGAGSVVVSGISDNVKAYGNPCKIQDNK